MKKLLLLLLTLTSITLSAQDVKTFVPNNYVSDFGDLYTPVQEANLNSIISSYEKKTSIEIAIITVESLKGESIEEFASEQFRRIGIGKKGADNGILIVFSKNDRKSRIETGNGMEPFFSDVNSYDALEVIKPYFRSGDYSTGTVECVNFITKKLGNQAFENKVLWLKQQKAKEAKESAATIESVKNFFINSLLVLLFFGILYYIWYLDKKKRERIAAEKELARLEALRVAKVNENITLYKNSLLTILNSTYSTKLTNSKIVMSALNSLTTYISSVDVSQLKLEFSDKTTSIKEGSFLKISGEDYLESLQKEKDRLNNKITAFYKIEKEIKDDISSINYLDINISDVLSTNKKALSDLVKIENYGYTKSYTDQTNSIMELSKKVEDIKTLLTSDIDGAIVKSKSLKSSIDYLKSNSQNISNYLNEIESAKNKINSADSEVNSILGNINRYKSYLKTGELDRVINEYNLYKTKTSNDYLSTVLILGTLFISLNRLLSTVRGRKEEEEAEIRRIEEAKRRKKREEEEAERRRRQREEDDDRRRRDSYSSSSSSSSSSDFGGFGGGSSSGGGASSGW